MVTVTDPQEKPDVLALKARCRDLHVTHDAIAKAAGVSRPLVVNVFAGRSTSRNVVETALALLAKAERRAARKAS